MSSQGLSGISQSLRKKHNYSSDDLLAAGRSSDELSSSAKKALVSNFRFA